MLVILQTSCSLHIVTMTNIICCCSVQFQLWSVTEDFEVLRICLDVQYGFRSVVFCGRGRHTEETVKMQHQTHRQAKQLDFQAWHWQFFWDCTSQMSLALQSNCAQSSECFDRQHRIASSRRKGAVQAQLRQECNQYQSQLWLWTNLVFCYWTWQFKKKKNSCLWDFLPQDAHHCLSVTPWQNSSEYYCAASADILLQLVAKSDYVLY